MANSSVFLVTGAFGALAARVLKLLVEEPDSTVVAIGRVGARDRTLPAAVELIDGDLRDSGVWARVPKTITHVFHLAAAIPWQRDRKTSASVVTENLEPLGHLLEHSQHWPNLRQIVYASSVSIYGCTHDWLKEDSPRRPAELYGAAKLAGEDLLLAAKNRDVRVASLRYSSLFGRGQHAGTVIPVMIRAATQTGRIRIFGSGLRSQDFLHYEEAAEAALLACRHGAEGAFNIGSGNPVTMTDLAELIRDVFTAGRAEIVHDREAPEGEPGYRIDISKASRELSYRPRRDLRPGLAQLQRESERG